MIFAGIGLRDGATVAALQSAIAATGQTPDALACLEIKASPAVHALADAMTLPLILLDEEDIAGRSTLTCSPRIISRFTTGSVAEASALAAARQNGHQARILAPRVVSPCGMATAALAERHPS